MGVMERSKSDDFGTPGGKDDRRRDGEKTRNKRRNDRVCRERKREINRSLTLSAVAVIRITIFAFASVVISQRSFSVAADTTGRFSTPLAAFPFTRVTLTFAATFVSIVISVWSWVSGSQRP